MRYFRLHFRSYPITAVLASLSLAHLSPSHAFSLNMSMSSSSTSTGGNLDTATGTSSGTSTPSSSSGSSNHPLSQFKSNFNHSWITQLIPESESNRLKSKSRTRNDDGLSNNVRRPVFNGHYVPVKPAPLHHPRLIIHSPDMVGRLGLDPSVVHSEEFVQYLSGDLDKAFAGVEGEEEEENQSFPVSSWATPYALSIMGKRYTNNCPFGTGDGYGDGRAISIGEILVPSTNERYELQLKGAGPTPFCRGADGRAVLRSSIREFLASEAMHALGIESTRALSLIVSEKGSTSNRPWYSDRNNKEEFHMEDPRLARYSSEQRRQIVAQLNAQTKNDPDIMVEEPNAITCRVARSFTRVGHVDLFARRATKTTLEKERPDKSTNEFKELEALIWHASFREFHDVCYEPFWETKDLLSASKALLEESMEGISSMVAGWVRVGFVQGNFNADNCLIAGRTMDYGPFGFLDEYHPLAAKWTGSGEHFGFMNQPSAGYANFAMLVTSVMPIIEAYSDSLEDAVKYQAEILEKAQYTFEEKLMQALRSKLGFHPQDEEPDELWADLEGLLRESKVDWTIFWRQLTTIVQQFPVHGQGNEISSAYDEMLELLVADDELKAGSSPFYSSPSAETRELYLKWIETWRKMIVESYKKGGTSMILSDDDGNFVSPGERMRDANPKYILREWMLVDAYSKASSSDIQSPLFPVIQPSIADESMVHELFELIQNPYDEGTKEQDEKYFRRAPDAALTAGGTAFMS